MTTWEDGWISFLRGTSANPAGNFPRDLEWLNHPAVPTALIDAQPPSFLKYRSCFFFTNPTGSNFTAVSMIPTVVVVKAPGVLLSSASVCFPLVKPPEFSSYLHLLKHPETPLFVQVNPPLFNL